MGKETKGMMVVLSSPSGAGKTTLTKKLAEKNKNFVISISHTKRKPRPKVCHRRVYALSKWLTKHFLRRENKNAYTYKTLQQNES